MDCVQFAQEICRPRHESVDVGVPLEGVARQSLEQLRHLPLDPFGIAEYIAALAGPARAIFTGPGIDVLEQVTVQRTIVRRIEVAGRWRLHAAAADRLHL